MFTIKNNTTENEKDHCNLNNYVFSQGISRPSKSLIDCELYKKYCKINFNLDIYNEYSYINSIGKSKEHYLLQELINIFKLHNIDIECLSLSFDTIIVTEIVNDNNILFCLDSDISLKNITHNLSLLIKELENNDSVIINFSNIFTYPSAELLAIFTYLFKKVKVYYCKLLKQNILYCTEYKNNPQITVYIKNIVKNWNNLHIRQYGIFITESLLNIIKKHNCYLFNYYINLSENIALSSLDEKEYLFKNYIKKHNKNIVSTLDCNHDLIKYNLGECYICIKCHDLFLVY